MKNFIGKIPSLRILLPAVAGIVISQYLSQSRLYWFFVVTGFLLMFAQRLVPQNLQLRFRWLPGVGVFICVLGIFGQLSLKRIDDVAFDFPENSAVYIGTIADIPQEKAKSVACNIDITHPVKKKIVLYVQKEERASALQPGDELIFSARISPFKNWGNPDDFDYAAFMRIKGFSGSAYAPLDTWMKTGKQSNGLYYLSQRFRNKTIRFYDSFGLDADAQAFITALTLGYTYVLDNDIKEAFRASGTSHVLAVSGFHVAILYMILSFLFSFLRKIRHGILIQQFVIVFSLWFYALLTGLPASVLRAVIMLTIFAVGVAIRQKGFTYNSMLMAAFIILLFNPFALFEVGFQLSFGAVFSILFFQPFFRPLLPAKNRFMKYSSDLISVSLAAQLGVFPIAMHYFGTFPTYFFIANILVVPLVELVMYMLIPTILLTLAQPSGIWVLDRLAALFHWMLDLLIHSVLNVVYFVESLPFSQIINLNISVLQMFLIILSVIMLFVFIRSRYSRHLILFLTFVFLLVVSFPVSTFIKSPAGLVVFNKPGFSDIGYYALHERHYPPLATNGFVPHQKTVLRLSDNWLKNLTASEILKVDVLILSGKQLFSMAQLQQCFHPDIVVFDSSIPAFNKRKMMKSCIELNLKTHDVSEEGAYMAIF